MIEDIQSSQSNAGNLQEMLDNNAELLDKELDFLEEFELMFQDVEDSLIDNQIIEKKSLTTTFIDQAINFIEDLEYEILDDALNEQNHKHAKKTKQNKKKKAKEIQHELVNNSTQIDEEIKDIDLKKQSEAERVISKDL